MKGYKLYMKPQDILVLLKIVALESDDWHQHTIADGLKISQSEVSESLNRTKYSGLIDSSKKRVAKLSLMDFIEYGIKYVFPQRPGPLVKGIPTAHSAVLFRNVIKSDLNYVWPYAKGDLLGQAIAPLYKSVPEAVLQDENLYELLVLVDAIRIGRARERNLAVNILRKKLS